MRIFFYYNRSVILKVNKLNTNNDKSYISKENHMQKSMKMLNKYLKYHKFYNKRLCSINYIALLRWSNSKLSVTNNPSYRQLKFQAKIKVIKLFIGPVFLKTTA